ncbi:YlxM family DNA-binding protein [Paenibacillus guangzhouensis]|uniref:YlxM family DNA-binding protein n=1 Tax=Paenibacillus guangzhouensis TaxID=1473112 RepID=UPI001266BCFA|nr:YlxM family DNA-binding protein [Paenibacillus guangzhouensis]
MKEENMLDKTNRVNLLFAFYESLLTEKQQTFLKCYFHDDFSLGEIAAEFNISRQAVYEHIKRAEQVLENYEVKLGLVRKYEMRHTYMEQLSEVLKYIPLEHREQARLTLEHLQNMDA